MPGDTNARDTEKESEEEEPKCSSSASPNLWIVIVVVVGIGLLGLVLYMSTSDDDSTKGSCPSGESCQKPCSSVCPSGQSCQTSPCPVCPTGSGTCPASAMTSNTSFRLINYMDLNTKSDPKYLYGTTTKFSSSDVTGYHIGCLTTGAPDTNTIFTFVPSPGQSMTYTPSYRQFVTLQYTSLPYNSSDKGYLTGGRMSDNSYGLLQTMGQLPSPGADCNAVKVIFINAKNSSDTGQIRPGLVYVAFPLVYIDPTTGQIAPLYMTGHRGDGNSHVETHTWDNNPWKDKDNWSLYTWDLSFV